MRDRSRGRTREPRGAGRTRRVLRRRGAAGRLALSLTVADDRADEAGRVMNAHNPVDIEERASGWHDAGWSGYDPDADPYSADEIREERQRYGTTV